MTVGCLCLPHRLLVPPFGLLFPSCRSPLGGPWNLSWGVARGSLDVVHMGTCDERAALDKPDSDQIEAPARPWCHFARAGRM